MEIVKPVDYAPHYLRAKVLLEDTYRLLNERKIEEAERHSMDLLVEVKLLLNAIKAQNENTSLVV